MGGNLKWLNVVSNSKGFTVPVRLPSRRHSRVGAPFPIVPNSDCSYSIKGVPDHVDLICYIKAVKDF